MTEPLDLSALEPLLQAEHLDGLVDQAMVRIRDRHSFATGLGRLWPIALSSAAASVLIAIWGGGGTPPESPAVFFDPVATFGTSLDLPRPLLDRAVAGETLTAAEAFVLLRPEGP